MGGSVEGSLQLNNLYPGPTLEADAGFPLLRPSVAQTTGATDAAAVWPSYHMRMQPPYLNRIQATLQSRDQRTQWVMMGQ